MRSFLKLSVFYWGSSCYCRGSGCGPWRHMGECFVAELYSHSAANITWSSMSSSAVCLYEKEEVHGCLSSKQYLQYRLNLPANCSLCYSSKRVEIIRWVNICWFKALITYLLTPQMYSDSGENDENSRKLASLNMSLWFTFFFLTILFKWTSWDCLVLLLLGLKHKLWRFPLHHSLQGINEVIPVL